MSDQVARIKSNVHVVGFLNLKVPNHRLTSSYCLVVSDHVQVSCSRDDCQPLHVLNNDVDFQSCS